MQYSEATKNDILDLHYRGNSGRQIAMKLNLSKSGVNDYIKQYKESLLEDLSLGPFAYDLALIDEVTKDDISDGPKILFLDIETSAALVYAFGRHKQFINQDAVEREGGVILMASYAWLHDPENIRVIAYKDDVARGEDRRVTQDLIDLIAQADAVVAHNGRNFDMKMIEARALVNDLPPLSTVHILDTLEMAKKKFRMPSNKLDSLGALLSIGRKVAHTGIDLWVRVQRGDEDALLEMIEYCYHDCKLLIEVYLTLRSRGLVSGFNAANYYHDDLVRCKSCGSSDIEPTGKTITTPTGIFNEVKCLHCGSLNRTRTNKSTKAKRKSLLAAPKF